MFVGYLYVFFGEMPVQVFCSFFDWAVCFSDIIMSYMNCLYILEINPLSVVLFAIIFSHSDCCLFILFMVSFVVQKRLSVIRPHLFIFIFISVTLGGESKRILF